VNEFSTILKLRAFMERGEGWGRAEGREVYLKLIDFIENHAGVLVFKVLLEDIQRMDISFASETIVEVARRYRGNKGFCIIDPQNPDLLENLEAAAQRKDQPLMVTSDGKFRVIGVMPSQGNLDALTFALERPTSRVAEFVSSAKGTSLPNASNKFRQLWEKGFLLRREEVAESGGLEFTYFRIC
jgi:hypothetical protein